MSELPSSKHHPAAGTSATKPKKLKKYKSFVSGIPSFQNRKTLADFVVDNMACASRDSYYQRIIYIYRLKDDKSIEEADFQDLVDAVNKGPAKDHMTGVLINYPKHAFHMIEGPEECLIQFINHIQEIYGQHWEANRIVLVYNNINQRFFHRAIIKYAEPLGPIAKETKLDPETISLQIKALVTRLYDLYGKMKSDELEEVKTTKSKFLTGLFVTILPEIETLDYILEVPTLNTIEEYQYKVGMLMDYKDFDDKVWPMPSNPLPTNIFEWGKYDINLTFGDEVDVPES